MKTIVKKNLCSSWGNFDGKFRCGDTHNQKRGCEFFEETPRGYCVHMFNPVTSDLTLSCHSEDAIADYCALKKLEEL